MPLPLTTAATRGTNRSGDGPMGIDFVPDHEFDALLVAVTKAEKADAAAGDAGGKEKFPAKLHVKKVVAELGVEDGLIYLVGQSTLIYEDSDMSPRFRQRRYFYYVTGVNWPGCVATYEVRADRLTLFIPYADPRAIMWHGRSPRPQDWLRDSDLDDVRYTSQLGTFLKRALGDTTLYVLHRDADHMPPAPSLPSSALDPSVPAVFRATVINTSALRPAMDRARVIKTRYEVGQIRRANDISSAAHRAVAMRFLAMTNERQVEAVFTATCIARGAHSQAYDIIAGAGPNAAVLHYEQNDGPLEKGQGQLLVLDAGCEWNCYASDITRTLPVGGRLTAESGAIYDTVRKMQEAVMGLMRPGMIYYKAHQMAAWVAQEELLKLGVLTGSAEEMWAAGTVAAFFPHGLGHHVGLETHDGSSLLSADGAARSELGKRQPVTATDLAAMYRLWGEECADKADGAAQAKGKSSSEGEGNGDSDDDDDDDDDDHDDGDDDDDDDDDSGNHGARVGEAPRPARRVGRTALAEGMVITVEPGVYFCREYIESYFLCDPKHAAFIDRGRLEDFYPVGGCRLEDDVLITEGGCENLTTAPKGQELWDLINHEGHD